MKQEENPVTPATIDGENSTLDIHQAVMREAADPNEAYDPGPRWFYAFAVAALAIAGFYLGRHFGAFGTDTHIGYLVPGAYLSTAGRLNNIPVSGATIYNDKCSSCHQADGSGVPSLFPPLAGAGYVLVDPAVTVRIVMDGLRGPLTVQGIHYNGVMPGWSDKLNDAEVASVVTYIRTQLGSNKAGAVEEAMVAAMRR